MQKVEHLHRTVGDKIAVLMDRQGLSEGEAESGTTRRVEACAYRKRS